MELGTTSLLLGLILSLVNILNWGYKYFNGAYKIKKDKDDLRKDVEKHAQELHDSTIKMDTVMTMINTLFEINKIQTRYSIVNACTEFIEQGNIEQYQLQSLEDMYSMYTEVLHGNSYVSTLMHKLRKLEITNGD